MPHVIRIPLPPLPECRVEGGYNICLLIQVIRVVAGVVTGCQKCTWEESAHHFRLGHQDDWHASIEGKDIVISTGLCEPEEIIIAYQTIIHHRLYPPK